MDFIARDRNRRLQAAAKNPPNEKLNTPKLGGPRLATNAASGTKFFSRESRHILDNRNKELDNIKMIRNRWKILNLVGTGGFGKVYTVDDTHIKETSLRKRMLACKIEPIDQEQSLLAIESTVLKQAKQTKKTRIPLFVDVGKTPQMKYLIMQFLGPSLAQLMRRYKSVSPVSVLEIIKQCTIGISELHELGIVHRDIKPSNFCVGYTDPDRVYIIDFGLCRQFKINGEIRPLKHRDGFKGTSRYVTLDIHGGKVSGPADDVKSLLYMAIEFFGVNLPWAGVKEKKLVYDIKTKYTTKKLLSKVEKKGKVEKIAAKYLNNINNYLEEVKNNEEVNYKFIISQLDMALADSSNGIINLEWVDELSKTAKKNKCYTVDDYSKFEHDSDDFLMDRKVKKKKSIRR